MSELEFDDVGSFHNENILVFDASALLYRSFYANKQMEEEYINGLVHHQFLMTINKYFKKIKPTKVILTFDRSNWRKVYTKSDVAITHKVYKGHRRQDQTSKQKEMYKLFMDAMVEFEALMREHTSIITLAAELLEADDIIAGLAEKFGDSTNKVTIVTTDQDMLQLYRYSGVEILNPSKDKKMDLTDWKHDWKWFLFVKMFRGDTGDNVIKALPKVRLTLLEQAYTDEYKLLEIMEREWSDVDNDGNELNYKVKDLYKENETLMDLSRQPDAVKCIINKTINDGVENPGKFSLFHFKKFCGKNDLRKLSEGLDKFIPLLSIR